MSNKKLNIKQNVMDQIKNEKVSMKPKTYYIFGSIIAFLGLIFSIVTSIFLFSIVSFITKSHGPMGQYRLEQLLSNFPWWALILGILGLILGIFFIRKYDFSYKFNPLLLIGIFVAAIIIAGFLIDLTGLDNLWLKRGPMNGIMRQYMQDANLDTPRGFQQNGRGSGQGRIKN